MLNIQTLTSSLPLKASIQLLQQYSILKALRHRENTRQISSSKYQPHRFRPFWRPSSQKTLQLDEIVAWLQRHSVQMCWSPVANHPPSPGTPWNLGQPEGLGGRLFYWGTCNTHIQWITHTLLRQVQPQGQDGKLFCWGTCNTHLHWICHTLLSQVQVQGLGKKLFSWGTCKCNTHPVDVSHTFTSSTAARTVQEAALSKYL